MPHPAAEWMETTMRYMIINLVKDLFLKYSDKKKKGADNRSEEVKDIGRGIYAYLNNQTSGHDFSEFSAACFETFAAAIKAFLEQGGDIKSGRKISFQGNLVQTGKIEGSREEVLGTLDEAIERTRKEIECGTIGKYINQADILSRNIRIIINFDLYISNSIIKKACKNSCLLEIIKHE